MKKAVMLVLVLFLLSSFVLAHIPYYNTKDRVVDEPEISKAYYGVLEGEEHKFIIEFSEPFLLYVNILGPYQEEKPDLKIKVFEGEVLLYESSEEWEYFYEEYGRDEYWRGSEFEKEVLGGTYLVEVSGSGEYSLAVGKEEKFGFFEIVRTLFVLPWIKAKIFGKYLMIGLALVILLLLIGLIVFIAKKKRK